MTPMKSSSSRPARLLGLIQTLGFALFSSAACSDPISAPAARADHGVVLLYHHIDEGTPASTSTTPARFEEHLDYIEQRGYTVMPLQDMIATLRAGGLIPDKALAITFDDAYHSVFSQAHPRLAARGWPYTVFVHSDAIAATPGLHLSWNQLRQMQDHGATIAGHSASHAHLTRALPGESRRAWQARVARDISRANDSIADQLGAAPPLFAYPYGEFTPELSSVLQDLHLVGLGQHSGAVGHQSDFTGLPRFPMATGYDSIDRLATALRARPLPVRATPPGPRLVDAERTQTQVTLEIDPGDYNLDQLSCYATGQGPMQQHRTRVDQWRIVPTRDIRPGRTKYNCTAPATDEAGAYFWWSYLIMRPNPDGSWYDY